MGQDLRGASDFTASSALQQIDKFANSVVIIPVSFFHVILVHLTPCGNLSIKIKTNDLGVHQTLKRPSSVCILHHSHFYLRCTIMAEENTQTLPLGLSRKLVAELSAAIRGAVHLPADPK